MPRRLNALDFPQLPPPLSHDETVALARRARAGDRAARAELAARNTRLVMRIALHYRAHASRLDHSDLVGLGHVGLMRAVDRFDPDRGTRFSTYAHWWIRQSITRGLLDQGFPVTIPIGTSLRARARLRVAEALGETLGRAPTDAEIDAAQGLTPAQTALVRLAVRAASESTGTAGLGDGDYRPLDALVDHRGPDREDDEAEAMRGPAVRAAIAVALALLTPREASIVRRRFGLDGHEPATLKEVGRRLGVGYQTVLVTQQRALRKLRGFLGEDLWVKLKS